ncbi:MMPL family transporter [Luteococcus sp. OSA5]|uniref:MMPL family transporter n=1 Tax=Luteococcus sp. OSA5 TaxID=3401630 RepID=UPI003B436245
MSSFLYRLGRSCHRNHKRVLALWLAILVVLGGLAGLAGAEYSDDFNIPGAPSQEALDQLRLTFPEAAATTAEAIVVLPEGERVGDEQAKQGIEAVVKDFGGDPIVTRVTSPFSGLSTGMISDNQQAALVQLQLEGSMEEITDEDRERLIALADRVEADLPDGSQVHMGGQAFSIEVPTLSATEVVGVGVALVVLFLSLGSLLAAGLPLMTAIVGVVLSLFLLMISAGLAKVNSTTPMLAVMLGLAVGIDYALFILSRHREQLRPVEGVEPMDAEESTARSVATAGSAVVFAGLTVCIALVGLGLANIPFLTIMGVFAAIAVALAVVIALTLLPALMGLMGERLRPRARKRRRRKAPGRGFFGNWVRLATRLPLLTVVLVTAVLGALSVPAANLQMSLPNAGQAEASKPQRVTYDLVSEHFGPGYNGPLIVTADILGSNDPMGVMDTLKKDIESTEGVAKVLIATPNRNADTGFVQVVPTTGPDDPATADLVQRLVDQHDQWAETPGVETAVTGSTAIQIDVSQRLAGALLPFGIFVVGLSFVLLMMVFRSVWVPLKATVGYLLSVGAAFGATQLVFNEGIGAGIINLEKPVPIISFMPIVIMGILFGLAMDYEVFLVSRMREDFVHAVRKDPAGDRDRLARAAIASGFTASAQVVTAAAVIMFAVFAFFVPEGMGPIKQIAFGLAVGVAVDAFVIRMTLVPAVLQLLGARAWHLPHWLDKMLPVLDVEGEGLHRELELAQWPSPDHREALHAEGLSVEGIFEQASLHLDPGQVAVVQGDSYPRRALLLTLAGRLDATDGKARVAGLLLPERAAEVRQATAFLEAGSKSGLERDLASALGRAPRVVFVDGADALAGPELAALDQAIADARALSPSPELASPVPEPVEGLPVPEPVEGPAFVLGLHDREAIARWRADRTIALLTPDPATPQPRPEAPEATTERQLVESL